MTQINYYLRPNNEPYDSKNAFCKILEYFISFTGDIEIEKENETSATVYYIGTPTTAHIKVETSGQLTIIVSPDDNITINLIKNIAGEIGCRIYNSQLNCYLPNNVNIYDLTTIKIDPNIKNVINLYHLNPLFQYRDTLIFFCTNKKSEVVLVNRHLLEYLINNQTNEKFVTEFSTKVAENISQFIALFDRGLISLTKIDSKIINLSSFNLRKLPKNTKLNIINFIFDTENQSFIQQETVDEIPEKYLALKIGQDYTYSMIDGKLTKTLNISVFN